MTVSRQVPVRTSAVCLLGIVGLGCASARDDPASPRPPAAFGPESLAVAFVGVPDTVATGAAYDLVAVAHNRTPRPVVTAVPCHAAGLVIRVVDAAGGVVATSPTGCPTPAGLGGLTLFPGDSVVVRTAGPELLANGTYTVQAVYEAADRQSRAVERPLVVRGGCVPFDPHGLRAGINVSVQDATTMAPLFAVVIAAEGSYRETLAPFGAPDVPAPLAYWGILDRPGTYTVSIAAPGYAAWRRDSIVVTRGPDCHVLTHGIKALLTLAP